MKIFRINTVYRQTAPDAEGHGGGGKPADPVATEEPAPEPPKDDGDDTIPPEAEDFWATLDKEFDGEDSEPAPSTPPAAEDPPKPPAEEEEPAPAEPEPAPEPEPPAPEPEPTPPEQPTEEPTPEVTPPVETPPEKTEEQLTAERTQQRDEFMERIQQHYALSDEEKLQMVTDPGTGFVKVMSRMYADMWYGFQHLVQQQMPQMVETGLKEVEERNEYVDKFFQAWPKLNRTEHGKTVAEVARVYSQTNPNATEEQVVKFVGMQTMLMHNIAPDMVQTPQGQPPAQPSPPATPPAEPSIPPHQPAAVHGSPPPAPAPGNEWEQYAEELLEDDANY